MGGKFHLKLNIGERPIANKYCEGKMKRTLKRESKGPEIVSRETIETSFIIQEINFLLFNQLVLRVLKPLTNCFE